MKRVESHLIPLLLFTLWVALLAGTLLAYVLVHTITQTCHP